MTDPIALADLPKPIRHLVLKTACVLYDQSRKLTGRTAAIHERQARDAWKALEVWERHLADVHVMRLAREVEQGWWKNIREGFARDMARIVREPRKPS